MDEVNFLSQTVGTLSAAPTKAVSNWMADQIAPDYWRPNSDIAGCFKCDRRFEPTEKIHHCRACGEGFCDKCSEYRRPVVERGWGNEPVRVCKRCYDAYTKNGLDMSNSSDPGDIQARKVSEKVVGTLGTLSSLFVDYPLNVIKDSARPEYWVPDEDIRECCTCKKNFADQRLKIHHCRACGEGVCDSCSRARRPVHDRGWDQPVRVCDECKIKLQSS